MAYSKRKSRLSKPDKLKNSSKLKVGLVVSQWHPSVTESLKTACLKTLDQAGLDRKKIRIQYVSGSFELPLAAKKLIMKSKVDGIICLGCVVKGETDHFTFICEAVAHGIMRLNLDHLKPVIFGVLTTNTLSQAKNRAGGKYGNKGQEAAEALLSQLRF